MRRMTKHPQSVIRSSKFKLCVFNYKKGEEMNKLAPLQNESKRHYTKDSRWDIQINRTVSATGNEQRAAGKSK